MWRERKEMENGTTTLDPSVQEADLGKLKKVAEKFAKLHTHSASQLLFCWSFQCAVIKINIFPDSFNIKWRQVTKAKLAVESKKIQSKKGNVV